MPLYDFSCNKCRCVSEHIVSRQTAEAPNPSIACPFCNTAGALSKLAVQASTAFHLKGSGWEKDGYSNARKTGI